MGAVRGTRMLNTVMSRIGSRFAALREPVLIRKSPPPSDPAGPLTGVLPTSWEEAEPR